MPSRHVTRAAGAGRRDFVRTAAGAAAGMLIGGAPLIRAASGQAGGQGSTLESMRLGVIGFGVQGLTDANSALRVPNVKVIAAASCYDGHLERARELLGDDSFRTRDYRAILDRKDIDAVVVATPDHWHQRIVLDALAAGKDVYCEKPLTHRIEEGGALVDAVAATKRIVQVGSQHVSSPHVIEAKQVIKDGLLGTVTQVKASWDTNNEISAWSKPIPPDASASTIDWERFQGSAPKQAFDPKRVFRWRTYREYGEGLAGDVLVHIITTIHYVLDLGVPRLATAVGGRFVWKDDRNVYDTITGGWEYPEGLITVLGASQNNGYDGTEIRLMGTKATMVLTFGTYKVIEEDSPANYRYTTNVWPKNHREEYWKSKGLAIDPAQGQGGPPAPRAPKVLKEWKPEPNARRGAYHMQAFVDAVRDRKTPVEDIVMGNGAAITAHMANLAYFEKKTVHFDRRRMKVVDRPVTD